MVWKNRIINGKNNVNSNCYSTKISGNVNRTVEFKTDEEPNIILKTGGRKGGATGTRKNIQYGAHLGDNKTWKEADNQKSG